MTALWYASNSPTNQLHLGYILPLMGIWFFDSVKAQIVTSLVFGSIFTRALINQNWVEILEQSIVKPEWYSYDWLLACIVQVAFWGAIVTVFATLRHVRNVLFGGINDLTELHLAMDELSKCLNQGLFIKRYDASKGKDGAYVFSYANSWLLKAITPLLRSKGRLKKNEEATIHDIWLKSDNELGMLKEHCDKYRRSDDQVRTLGHFEDLEPSFNDPDGMLWTVKQKLFVNEAALGKAASKVERHIGVISSGVPIQMLRNAEALGYALLGNVTMKNESGHIIWANEQFLQANKKRIRALSTPKLRNADLLLQVRKFRCEDGEFGPLDSHFYDETEATQYREFDRRLMDLAQSALDRCNGVDESSAVLKAVKAIIPKDAKDYPRRGWGEFHKPIDQMGSWVEVRKMPFWDHRTADGKAKVRGVVVVFSDHTESFRRKHILEHWINYHLTRARICSAAMVGGRSLATDESWIAELPMMRLYIRMTRWMREFISKDTPHRDGGCVRTSEQLKQLIQQLPKMYNWTGLKLDCDEWLAGAQPIEFRHGGDEFSAIAIILTCNAGEACMRPQKHGADDAFKVKVSLNLVGENCVLTVQDNGCGCSADRFSEIRAGKALAGAGEDGKLRLGGGLFLADCLMSKLVNQKSAQDGILFQRRSDSDGVCATVAIAKSALGVETR